MNNGSDDRTVWRNTRSVAGSVDMDVGLRSYMIRVFNFMALGLALTGVVAFAAASSPELMATIYGTPLKWVIMFAPLIMVFFISFKIESLNLSTAQTLFWTFAAVMGLSMASIFILYTGQSIARVFFITASTFGAMSLYGYTTKKDLTSWGSFLFMGLIGVIIASFVNIFLQSNAMQFVISVIGVLVFTGLTAYDTQKIKEMYYVGDGEAVMGKKALMGALNLYLDFINLFLMLLRLFGDRR